MRGKSAGEKDIFSKPIYMPSIIAPEGSLIVVSTLIDDKLSYTDANGILQQIEISFKNLNVMQCTIQTIYDCFYQITKQ